MNARSKNRLMLVTGALVLAILACQGTKSAPTPTGPAAVPTSVPPQATSVPTQNSDVPAVLSLKPIDTEGDVDSSSMATAKGISGGDAFVQGLYERPFNANTMDKYFPYLDIVQIKGYKDDTWSYLEITLAGTDKNGKLPAQYAAELDLNKDGRGEWLIRASNPSTTSWSTQGVQVWKDTDGDVGGAKAMVADTNLSSGDGYETLVFDQGKGDTPDGAWARISPDDPKTVQIVFKLSMVGNPDSFAMGAWAEDKIDPSRFDYNDRMTHAQAGDPNQANPQVYPIKDLAEVDNSCRLAINFVPTSVVPGLCEVPQVVHPGGGGCPAGKTYVCSGGIAAMVSCGCK